jgi:hypothetical protein
MVAAVLNGEPVFVAAKLDNELYARAIHAHRRNRSVTLRGAARRMKTQFKMTHIGYFEELHPNP